MHVFYKQIIVRSAREACRQFGALNPDIAGAAAASAGAIEAVTIWQERHAGLLQQKNVVLQDQFSRAELLKMADDARIENNGYMSRAMAAPAAERLRWCQQMPTTLASLEFDLMSNPDLVRKIMDYKPVRQGLQPDARH